MIKNNKKRLLMTSLLAPIIALTAYSGEFQTAEAGAEFFLDCYVTPDIVSISMETFEVSTIPTTVDCIPVGLGPLDFIGEPVAQNSYVSCDLPVSVNFNSFSGLSYHYDVVIESLSFLGPRSCMVQYETYADVFVTYVVYEGEEPQRVFDIEDLDLCLDDEFCYPTKEPISLQPVPTLQYLEINIIDDQAPVIDPHADVTEEATGPGGAIVNYVSPATSDAVDGPGVATCAPLSGSLFALGSTPVTCTATDAAGNSAAPTNFNVIVQDTTAPVITCPPNVEIVQGASTEPENTGSATATDNSGEEPTIGWTNASFVIGANIRTWHATDGSGNTSYCDQVITILQDNQPPVAADDHFETNQETPVSGNVFVNDFDPDGDALHAVLAVAPSNGVVILNPNGDFTYTPNTGFAGNDEFVYVADDGTVSSNPAFVTIVVNSNEDQIEDIIGEVEGLDLPQGTENSLLKKLENAISNLTNEDPTDDEEACEKLQSFVDQVNALVKSERMTPEQAQPLITQATDLLNVLCPLPG